MAAARPHGRQLKIDTSEVANAVKNQNQQFAVGGIGAPPTPYAVKPTFPVTTGPYPFTISGERVPVESVPVTMPKADHPLLVWPNRITSKDFEGWVQERGLYFATRWDARYDTVLVSSDPGEKPLAGGLLYGRYGRGYFVYTGYSWFRQLPAGVSGAIRLFVNLLSQESGR